jgi:hypothetical protein
MPPEVRDRPCLPELRRGGRASVCACAAVATACCADQRERLVRSRRLFGSVPPPSDGTPYQRGFFPSPDLRARPGDLRSQPEQRLRPRPSSPAPARSLRDTPSTSVPSALLSFSAGCEGIKIKSHLELPRARSLPIPAPSGSPHQHSGSALPSSADLLCICPVRQRSARPRFLVPSGADVSADRGPPCRWRDSSASDGKPSRQEKTPGHSRLVESCRHQRT